jgi:hypothetical protein
MATPRGPSPPEGACRRCGSSPGTPATPSSSRRCKPRLHHLGLRRRSAPRSAGRGSTSRTGHLLLRFRASHMSSFARAGARAPALRAADASAGRLGTGLLLRGRGVRLPAPEQPRRGWGERRLDLVDGDRGAGAGGGPHLRSAPELALWRLRRVRRRRESRRRSCLAASCASGAGGGSFFDLRRSS